MIAVRRPVHRGGPDPSEQADSPTLVEAVRDGRDRAGDDRGRRAGRDDGDLRWRRGRSRTRRPCPAITAVANDADGTRPPHAVRASTGSIGFDARGRATGQGRARSTRPRAARPGSTIRGPPRDGQVHQLRRRRERPVQPRRRPRQARDRRRHGAAACRTSTRRRRRGNDLMPGPEIQAAGDRAPRSTGFPLHDAARTGSTSCWWSCSACSRRSPGLRLQVRRSSCSIGARGRGRACWSARSSRSSNRRDHHRRLRRRRRRRWRSSLTGAIHGLTVAFEREQARDAFARFVPEAVVDQVLADADGVRLGGVRGEATVMFSDLRGFTSFSRDARAGARDRVAQPLPDRDERGDPRPRRHARGLHGRRHHGRLRRAAEAGGPRRPRAGGRARDARADGRRSTAGCASRSCTTASRWASA